MTKVDHYGNPVCATRDATIESYDRGVHLFLGGQFGAVAAFEEALGTEPDFAMGHAGLARAAMAEGRMDLARSSIARAERLAEPLGDRARGHVRAIALVLAGRPAEARIAAKTHLREHPRDALVAQLCTSIFGLIGFSGETGREADLLAFTSALLPQYGEDWWMMAMHAVSLCETGKLAASAELMDRALALNPDNANAAHFRAHVHYESGQTATGRAFLADWLQGYDRRSILHGHLTWHSALWALQEGDAEAMWAAVDAGVAPGGAQGLPINVVTDTAAILYRANLAGIGVAPERWRSLSTYAARMFPDPGQSFVDLHAALAHAMAGEGGRLARICETSQGFAADLVRPVARAWGAIARGDWAGALDDLVPVMAGNERLGGSRAQRDLLELTYASVLMRLGRADEAARSLALRRPVLAKHPPLAALH